MSTRRHIPLLIALVLLAGCTPAASHTHDADKRPAHKFKGEYPIKAVCTIGQVTEMVQRIGGQHVKAEGIMGPGVDPHLFTPVHSDTMRLSRADVIFYNGLH